MFPKYFFPFAVENFNFCCYVASYFISVSIQNTEKDINTIFVIFDMTIGYTFCSLEDN